jgi:hypothetical protein
MRARIVVLGLLTASALGLLPTLGTAQINVDITLGTPPPPPIVLPAPPPLVVVPRTQVFYAPAVPYNYFFYGGKYYVAHEGTWFIAPAYQGPWTVVAVERVPEPLRRVPVTYYKVPPGHRKEGGPPWGRGHGKGHKHKKHKDHEED